MSRTKRVVSRLRRALDHVVAKAYCEGSSDEEYTQRRLQDGQQMLLQAQPFVVLFYALRSHSHWQSGDFTGPEALGSVTGLFVVYLLAWLVEKHLQAYFQMYFSICASALQAVALVMNFVCGELFMGSARQSSVSIGNLMMLVASQSFLSCLPDKVFYPFSAFVASFLFHRARAPLYSSELIEALVMACGLIMVRQQLRTHHWQIMKMERDLARTKSHLEELMTSNRCLFKQLFEAACTCDSEMKIMEATPQMGALLGREMSALVGLPFQFLISDGQSSRVRELLQEAWRRRWGITMIQTFLRSTTADGDEPQPQPRAASVDVRLFCIQLPGTNKNDDAHSSSVSTMGSLFVGLQTSSEHIEHGGGGMTSRVASQVTSTDSETTDADTTLSLTFEADSEGFQVVSCSTELESTGVVGLNLLELIPARCRNFLDALVYDEVQAAPEGHPWTSPKKLQDLVLELPGDGGTRIKARRAWLVINPELYDECEVRMPVALHLMKVRVRTRLKKGASKDPGTQASSADRSLTTIEEGVDEAPDDATGDAMSSCCDSDLFPEDSASQVSSGVIRLRPTRSPHPQLPGFDF